MFSNLTVKGIVLVGVISICSLDVKAVNAQDVTMGGDARMFGMGGAGLSLPHRGGARLNPASIAFEKSFMGYSLPSVGIRTRGPLKIKDSRDYADTADNKKGTKLISDTAQENTELAANTSLSIRLGPFEVAGVGLFQARNEPNEILRNWGKSGSTFPIPDGARSDVFALGYAQVSATTGMRFPLSLVKSVPGIGAVTNNSVMPTSIAVGVRAKQVQGYYTHYIADTAALNSPFNNDQTGNLNGLLKAPEMNGNSSLQKSAFGADIGILARNPSNKGLSFGVVIANFVKPNLTFDGTDGKGNSVSYAPMKSTISLGAGFEMGDTSFAADIVDFGSAVANRDLRIGAELRVMKVLAIRGGVSARNGVSAGIGLGGLGIAVSNKQAFETVQMFKF